MPTLCLVEVNQLRTKAVDGRRALFSIKEGNKQKSEKHHTSSSHANVRRMISTKYDRGGPCHHFRSITFLGPINSFAARGRRKFG